MTAEVGFPTLRLIRAAIGPRRLEGLAPGEWRKETLHAPRRHRRKRRAPARLGESHDEPPEHSQHGGLRGS